MATYAGPWAAYGMSSAGWTVAYDVDFTALDTTDYDHTAATVSIDSKTWTQTYGATALADLDLTNGTGLVPLMAATSTTFNVNTPTSWDLTILASTLFGSAWHEDLLWKMELITGDVGTGNAQMCGPVAKSSAGIMGAHAVGIGSEANQRLKAITQDNTSVNAYASIRAHDSAAMIIRGSSSVLYSGNASGTTFPTWGQWGRQGFQMAGTVAKFTDPLIGVMAYNTSGAADYAPSFKRLRLSYFSGPEVP